MCVLRVMRVRIRIQEGPRASQGSSFGKYRQFEQGPFVTSGWNFKGLETNLLIDLRAQLALGTFNLIYAPKGSLS